MIRIATCVVVTFMAVAGIGDCNSDGPPAGEDDLAKLEAEIRELIGEAPATDVSFCAAIAFGSKPCGGPWDYLVYSSEHTDADALKAKVDEYNRLQDRINREKGLVSDCMIVGPPEINFEGGFCVAGSR